MAKKILIMGLPGAGKTFLAKKLAPLINAEWLNADIIRKKANDWDFSEEGRKRQSKRMSILSNEALKNKKNVIADFVCPTPKTRKNFSADFVIWVDTITKSRFQDTNQIFIPPKKYDIRVTTQNADIWSLKIADKIQPYRWSNKKPTAQMLGRWQPWHLGHQTLFEEILKKTGQVNIMVRDVQGIDDNPFDFQTVKINIEKALFEYKGRFKVSLVPNITNICYGRSVGYKIEEIKLPEQIQKISATKIRNKMRLMGKLKKVTI